MSLTGPEIAIVGAALLAAVLIAGGHGEDIDDAATSIAGGLLVIVGIAVLVGIIGCAILIQNGYAIPGV